MSGHVDTDWLNKLLQRATRGDGWVRVNCPVCLGRTGRSDKRASFGLHSSSGWWHCFRCNAAGRIHGFEEHDGPKKKNDDKPIGIPPPEGYVEIGRGDGKTALSYKKARDYLRKRNILTSTVRSASIGFSLDGLCRNRVIMPFLTAEEGVWAGWVARDITGTKDRKYLNARGMQRARLLYNANCLLTKTEKPVIVVEGIFDALACHGNAVALLGKPSDEQVEALLASSRPIAVVLDGDAWREGWALAKRLRLEGAQAGYVRMPARTDPDEVGWDWLEEQVEKCITAPL